MSECKTSPEKTQEEPLHAVAGTGCVSTLGCVVTMMMTGLGRATNRKSSISSCPSRGAHTS